jgi:hypothetical protein
MSNLQIPPTSSILKVCDYLEMIIARFIEHKNKMIYGEYESDLECNLLLNLTIRHIEGVILLARQDLVSLPPAMSASRSAFEISIKAMWMMDPEDVFAREVRWLAHIKTEEDYWKRIGNLIDKLGGNNDNYRDKEGLIRQFREDVTKVLPSGYKLETMPNMREMVRSLNREELYLAYILFSQFEHGTHFSTNIYRRNLGIYKQIGEYITPRSWIDPFKLCWFSLHTPASVFIRRIGGDAQAFLPLEVGALMQSSIEQIE